MNTSKRIFLAAGVFYPDVGGPAIHVRKIAEALIKKGCRVVVLAYGDDPLNTQSSFPVKRISRRHPKIFQWILYTIKTIHLSIFSDIVYAFDPTAAGMPACFAAKILGRPFFIRVGGDPIWEREAEAGTVFMSLDQYYKEGLYKRHKLLLFKMIRWVLKCADVVVLYNQAFKNFYSTYYSVSAEKIHVIKNPVFKRDSVSQTLPSSPILLFAGRFVKYKNLLLVMRAFDTVRQKTGKGKLMLIGKGPEKDSLIALKNTLSSGEYIEFIESLPQEQLFEKIKESSIALGPALSEFNPNFILEALSFGKPVLLSRGHGLSVDLPEECIFDPKNEQELVDKILNLFDPVHYASTLAYIATLDMNQTWDKVTDVHVQLLLNHQR